MTRESEISKVFDEFSTDYTRKMVQYVPFYSNMLESLIAFLPQDFSPKTILELGCGNGNATALLLHHYPNASFHLVDASDQMLQLCKERFGTRDNFHYENALFQELELEAHSFDLVVAGISLHHLKSEEKQEIFRQTRKAMKVDGIFACCDLMVNKSDQPYHSKVLEQWQAFLLSQGAGEKDWEWLMDHYANYDYPDAFIDQKQWLESAGFSKVNLSWNDGPWTCFHAYT